MTIKRLFRVIFQRRSRRTDYIARRVNRACEMQERASVGLAEAVAVLLARDERKVVHFNTHKRR